MRVITGEAKGKRLAAVPGDTTRPITDRVKQAVFSILSDRIEGARFLDLFAGTGGVGIEALSRGAEMVTFVEKAERATQVIRANLKVTGLVERARIARQDVFRFLAAPAGERYDLIYVAPPQYQGLWAKTVEALDRADWLLEDGLIVVQIFPKEYMELPLARLRVCDQRRYGSTSLVFYEQAEAVGKDQ
jgi:16S rRNA (guanine(966)-N(2))-methyltransferase RsmD